MKPGTSHSNGKDTPFMSEMNMIPLIDVSLVLLIIFMIVTPYMVMNSIQVSLPKSASTTQPPGKTVIVTIQEGGNVFINNVQAPAGSVAEQIKGLLKESPDGAVIYSDKSVKIETVVDVIDQIQAGGIHKINLTTEHKSSENAPVVPVSQ